MLKSKETFCACSCHCTVSNDAKFGLIWIRSDRGRIYDIVVALKLGQGQQNCWENVKLTRELRLPSSQVKKIFFTQSQRKSQHYVEHSPLHGDQQDLFILCNSLYVHKTKITIEKLNKNYFVKWNLIPQVTWDRSSPSSSQIHCHQFKV